MYLKTQLTSPAAAVPSIPRSISPGPPTRKRVQALLGLSGYDLPYQKSPSPLVAEDDAPGDPKESESLRTAKNPSKASEELLPRMVEYQTALLHQFGEVALWNHGTKGNSSEISSQQLSVRAPLLFLQLFSPLTKDSSALDGLHVPPPASLVCYLQIKLSLQWWLLVSLLWNLSSTLRNLENREKE